MGVKPYVTRYLDVDKYPTSEGGVLKAPEVERELARMLSDGWELVTITSVRGHQVWRSLAVFRRLGDGS